MTERNGIKLGIKLMKVMQIFSASRKPKGNPLIFPSSKNLPLKDLISLIFALLLVLRGVS
jgi:hypothetical protein